jgi:hypothetical protein
MVSSRHRDLFRSTSGRDEQQYRHLDLENGNGQPRTAHPRQRFRDAIDATMT